MRMSSHQLTYTQLTRASSIMVRFGPAFLSLWGAETDFPFLWPQGQMSWSGKRKHAWQTRGGASCSKLTPLGPAHQPLFPAMRVCSYVIPRYDTGPTLLSAVATKKQSHLCTVLGHWHGPRWQPRSGMSSWLLVVIRGVEINTDPCCCITMDPDMALSMDQDFTYGLKW